MAEKARKKRIVVASESKCSYFSMYGKVILPSEMDAGCFQGYVFRFINESNYGGIVFYRKEAGIVGHGVVKGSVIKVFKVVAGVSTIIAESEKFFTEARTGGKLEISVNQKGEITYGYDEVTIGTVSDEDFITGHPLAEGKLGVYDEYYETPTIAAKRKYSEPTAIGAPIGEEELENAVCFAGRAMELRSDGVWRQHKTEDVWTRLVPDGFLPYAPPSGLEARALKGILLPSAGNFEVQPDVGAAKISAQVFYFPGYHFTSEAI